MAKKTRRSAKKEKQTELTTPDLSALSWDDLRIFLVCADEESFRKAAVRLQTSASTVSRHIDRLEQALALQLFDRLPEGALLTHEGRLIAESARQMERALAQVVSRQPQDPEKQRGTVTLAITEGLGNYWVLPRLLELQQDYPLLTVHLKCEMRCVNLLKREAEIAIQFDKPDENVLPAIRLGRMHVFPFASKGYIEKFGTPRFPKDVKNHRFVHQVSDQVDEHMLADKIGLASIDEMVGIRTNTSTACLYSIERGAGIGALPTYAAALGAPVVPVDMGIRHSFDIWMTHTPEASESAHGRMLMEWLKTLFDPDRFAWFRDDFIHPRDLTRYVSSESRVNLAGGHFTPKPFDELT